MLSALTCAALCTMAPFVASPESAGAAEHPERIQHESTRRGRLTIGGFVGCAVSDFEDQAAWGGGAATALPLGMLWLVRVSSRFAAGIELQHTLVPFAWDLKPSGKKIAEWAVSHTTLTLLGRHTRRVGGLNAYARLGFGIIFGKVTHRFQEGWGRDYEYPYDPGGGGSFGLGIAGELSRIAGYYLETVYHVAYRRINAVGEPHHWDNFIAVQAGLTLTP